MNIYLPFEKEKALREYVSKTGKSISEVVGELIDSLDVTIPIEEKA